eukprot:1156673-Pelagomonas_calceolata.AAC.4
MRTLPTSIKEKETLAQTAVSLPHPRVRGKLVWVWWDSRSMRPQGTRIIVSTFFISMARLVEASFCKEWAEAFVQAW